MPLANHFNASTIAGAQRRRAGSPSWGKKFFLSLSGRTTALILLCCCCFLSYFAWDRLGSFHQSQLTDGPWIKGRRDLKEQVWLGKQNDGSPERLINAERQSSEFRNFDEMAVENSENVKQFPISSSPKRLLLSTHNRLMWYHYETEEVDVIHEGEGVYYGGFPGEELDADGVPTTVWVVSRPHNWKPKTTKEWLIQLDAATGQEIQRKQIYSKFTHDTVRHNDRVYVADCGEGSIIELEFPSMDEIRRMQLFTPKEHINTISPVDKTKMWVMLHNLGPSYLAEIDLITGTVTRKLENVGMKAHGAVMLGDSNSMLILDSNNGCLVKINLDNGEKDALWDIQSSEYYLKGLAVVDNIAFFGIAPSERRETRASENTQCELAAFDLSENVLLWKRQLQTRGLLNTITAPHLQVESTAYAVNLSDRSKNHQDARGGSDSWMKSSHLDLQNYKMEPTKSNRKPTLLDLESFPEDDHVIKYPAKIDEKLWASGYPRFDLIKKGHDGFQDGVQILLYREDVTALKNYILSLPDEDWYEANQRASNAWLTGRDNVLNRFKPNTSAIHVIFSDQRGEDVYEYPWYEDRFKPFLEPMLDRLLGEDKQNIIRLQFARMPAHSHILRHVDSGGYSSQGHRLHIVVASSPSVEFQVCETKGSCLPLHVEEGIVFELNNRLKHYVNNDGDSDRIHIVIDVAENPRQRKKLRRGQVCEYGRNGIICDDSVMSQ